MADDDDDTLVQRWQQHGDERARDTLLRRYDRLLKETASRAERWGFDFDDGYQLSAMGFLRALDTYDSSFGASVQTYARRWIRHYLHHGRQHLGPVRRPSHAIEGADRLRRILRCEGSRGRERSISELASLAGLDTANAKLFVDSAQQGVSLDTPIGDDGTATIVDYMADDRASPEDILEARERRRLLVEAIEALPGKQGETARLYYLDGRTLEEIGTLRGISRQGAHLMLQKAQAGIQARLLH
jgi:RNA polymerase primary sigma factor